MAQTQQNVLRLGTRGSLLARTQSGIVADQLRAAHHGLAVELITISTTGDRVTDRPLHDLGGKGLFTKELELALLGGRIDLAVHSFKDVPVTMPLVDAEDLVIAAVPAREDARDVLISTAARSVDELPPGARVGTGSLRRRCQLLARRGDLHVEMLRGNVDTRLRKLRDGQYDAIVLALAGVKRAGLFDAAIMSPIDEDVILPAPGQGALALQCRRDDAAVRDALATLNHAPTALAVKAERAIVAALAGDCHSPIAAHAVSLPDGRLSLRAAVGGRDGVPPVVRAQAAGNDAEVVVADVRAALAAAGAERLLHG